MESLKFIGISICIVTVITSIFTMLLPESKLDNVIKFAITLFFLTSIITPFLDSELRIDIKTITKELAEINNYELEEEIANTFIMVAKIQIENEIEEIMKIKKINIKKVEIDINILEKESIYIEKVKVYIPNEEVENAGEIEEIIKTEIGIIPEIIEI